MRRRHLLGSIGTGITLLSGCTGGETGKDSDDNELKDTDGDGVIDSEDYAPNDPDVQEKSDLQDKTTQATARAKAATQTTVQPETTVETTTTATTTTIRKNVNTLEVTDDYWQDIAHITAYSSESVDIFVPAEPRTTDLGRAKVAVALIGYPREGVITYAVSDSFETTTETELGLDIDPSDAPTGERLAYTASIFPGEKSFEEASGDDFDMFMETDPFVLREDRSIERRPHPDALDATSSGGFSRDVIEGTYLLKGEGRTAGRNWTTNFFIFKGAYLETANRSRGRSRKEYVNYALTEGFAPAFAQILKDEAEANGFTEPREQVGFVIDFVQRLPYVPDDVSKGFDDYTKFCVETLVELEGDCEDTSILLASILQAEAFNYDMILIQPPGHMAAGIYTSDPSGYYWELDGRKYSYIETTGAGWDIGDLPDQYKDTQATLHQV